VATPPPRSFYTKSPLFLIFSGWVVPPLPLAWSIFTFLHPSLSLGETGKNPSFFTVFFFTLSLAFVRLVSEHSLPLQK